MNVSCDVANLLIKLVNLYSIVLIVYALLSWVPDLRGPWTRYLNAIVEPVVGPVRRIIPSLGGLDLSVLIVLLVLNLVVMKFLYQLSFNVCY